MIRKVTDDEIISAWKARPSVSQIASAFDMSCRAVNMRVRKLRARGVELPSQDRRSAWFASSIGGLNNHPAAIHLGIRNGHILIGSDSHYWPGMVSTAHDAFVAFAKEYKPKIIIKNGDEADFPTISRHAPIAWEKRPQVSEEIDNVKAMLSEIEKVSPNSRRIWPLGNHDSRFETRLATIAPEYAKVNGVHLKDNFQKWEPCWAAFINNDVVVKHRIKGGVYATRNNTIAAGRSVFTGHLHSLKVWPHSDYNGTRFGGDCGTMADPYGPQFYNYTELGPLDWRSGFLLLTFVNGEMLWPEQIFVRAKGVVDFRGKLHNV